MPLALGTKLGPYEIQSPLGAGGMGEVYRARDTRLDRTVAIKVLPDALAHDTEHLQRFEHEARVLSTLNHPNLLAIYDVGTESSVHYLVSEFLEGQTLRERLSQGGLGVRRATEYALQIASGLSAAHEKGIVHRDLKPENVFVTNAGRAKILDFGLAKTTQTAEAGDKTLTVKTTPGVVLGTVGYMAPEQVRGLPTDARSDLFSFGAMLYEMLSGKRAFQGATTADTMSAILKEDPPELSETTRNVPPALEQIVRHCLEKNPQQRFQSAHDLAFDLEQLSRTSGSSVAIPVAPKPWRIAALKPLLISLMLAVLAVGVILSWRGTRPYGLPTFRRLTFERGMILSARFAADGKNVIYGASWESKPVRLFSTPFDSPQARPLELESASLLGVSRSGEMAVAVGGKISSHLVIRGATLARAPIAGGAPREILEDVMAADWSPDGQLAVVHVVGGRSRLEYPIGKILYETGGWISHMRISTAGDRIAFMLHPGWPDDRGFVAMVDLNGNEKNLTPEWEGEEGLAWSPKGDEVWFTATLAGADRALYAVTPAGKLRALLRIPGGLTLHDISAEGRVLLSFVDERVGMRGAREGEAERDLSWLGWTVSEAVSPDGKWVLFSEQGEPAGNSYILAIRSFDGSAPVRLGEGNAFGFSPDGKWAAATRADGRPQITLLPTGTGQPKKIDVATLEVAGRACFFPDGKRLVVNGVEHGHAFRTYAVDIATGKPIPITPEGVVSQPALSRDGSEVGAQDLSGNIAIYSIEGKPARIVPETNGLQPFQWSVDGHSLYAYVPDEMPGRLLRVDAVTGRQQLVRRLLPGESGGVYAVWSPEVTPDGKAYAYSYRQTLSTLYVAEGLR